ncbi:hypothetical protein EDD68_10973 [Melghiribacillus thermohalophilus]|uniref:Uncharacterized protein n=1 Tax=Melghiribacillus thermohalophilus TaxID=1324956 RepID=A0A4R3N368_9BACI|nr:hypothetical protein EDD68_10973 [Melghiribacillus thermohalophilus]
MVTNELHQETLSGILGKRNILTSKKIPELIQGSLNEFGYFQYFIYEILFEPLQEGGTSYLFQRIPL